MADSGSLVKYLETFDHTVAVMQTAAALTRVARECVEDLAADGVVYAEVRYAPEQHVSTGLSLDEVVAAVQQGFEEGMAATGITVRQLLTAMRHQARSREIAELSIAWRDRGVAGFDIAGAEAGYPPTRHLDAFEYLQRENSPLHHPRRRGVRAAVDLGGDPVVRRGPARPRCPDHRRHHGLRLRRRSRSAGSRRTSVTCGSRSRCARPPTCRPAPRPPSPSTRSGCSPGCGSGSRSTPTTGSCPAPR